MADNDNSLRLRQVTDVSANHSEIDLTIIIKVRDGHANALIVGPDGLEPREDARVGVSLMAPAVQYPDHRHPPEEVYVALSPGEWRQGDGPWHAPGPGGLVYNPPGIVHAMRSGKTPLLAIWCLWVGGA